MDAPEFLDHPLSSLPRHARVGEVEDDLFLALAAVMLTLLVVVLFWDSHRITAITLLCVAYAGAGVAIAAAVRTRLRSGSKLFSASLAELAKDRERLRSPDA